ncbi:WD repeat-containing protein 91 [Pleodorina starrii]|uniref:WD repeat-containing protein 91 n=1 Tax=Pleodorina starrii TaxID=330485 RepID=A0A9W6F574_9CHLO|nr:WD repeat-containing protein 91 [Pleodorina starrii]
MSLSVSVSVARPRCSHLGTFRGKLPFGIKPTGKVIEEPPQTASLTFNAAGQVEGYTMGYVMDRMVGNTNGLGGVFGLMWALGAPLPAPEGHPWSPSLQLRLVNSGVWLLQDPLPGLGTQNAFTT